MSSKPVIKLKRIFLLEKEDYIRKTSAISRPESVHSRPAGQLHCHGAVQQPGPLLQPEICNSILDLFHSKVVVYVRRRCFFHWEVLKQQLHSQQDAQQRQGGKQDQQQQQQRWHRGLQVQLVGPDQRSQQRQQQDE